MSGGPTNATIQGDGFRFYRWDSEDGSEPVSLLSVTSIRKLCGEPYVLVNWQIGNVIDTVLGTVKRPAIGKRGKPLKGVNAYVPEEFPSEFAKMYEASGGTQEKMDEVRRWLRETADEPRNIAAIRGTIVHSAIEKNVAYSRVERPWVESEFADLSNRDKAKAKGGVKDEDVRFVRAGVRQYWNMRAEVPFIIIAREPQVFNLAMGYGGSADALCWFLPEGFTKEDAAGLPKPHLLTLKIMESIGGYTAVGDWKTSKGVYTDQVTQCHAYGGAEFVGENGVINHRLTDILHSTTRGVLFHIRPNKWGVHTFDFTEEVFHAFEGSVAFARFLAKYPRPTRLFINEQTGGLADEEFDDDDAE